MGVRPRRAILEVNQASRPISGRLTCVTGERGVRFSGWIELTAAIEALRVGEVPWRGAVDGGERPQPPSQGALS